MRLVSDYSWYFLLLCLLLGMAYSAVLYVLGRKRDSFSRTLRWGLALIRCITVTLIAGLLLAPMMKREVSQKEKPIIVVAQDNSQSVMMCKDSAYYNNEYRQQMEHLIKELEKDFDVHRYTFGERVAEQPSPDYHESQTDIAGALTDLKDRFEGRNVGAFLLASDGIFNQGLNPANVCEGWSYPVYTVALGDTSVRRDALVSHLRYNRIAYLGNQFPLEIMIGATQLKGQQKKLTVTHEGKVLFATSITYNSDDYSSSEQVILNADRPGLHTYTIHLEESQGEVSTRNNTRTITIEVIDGHQKVVIIAAAPHPDVAAIRRSLEENQNYEVESYLLSDFKGRVSDYDLVVLHNLPMKGGVNPQWLTSFPADVPAIFVIGMQTDISRFNNLHMGLEIVSRINQYNETTPLCNSAFALFSLNDDVKQRIELFPPLCAPFGEFKCGSNTASLITAKLGSVQTGLPLVAFSQKGAARYAFICGEGIWRWRMADYGSSQNHDAFNTLINKTVVYASMKVDKDKFNVETPSLYHTGEPVVLEATLYDDNYELFNTPEVEIVITGATGKPGKYLFNRTSNAYSLNVGVLEAGRYSYTASTTFGKKKLTTSGTFVVEEVVLEDLSLVADHSLLNTIAVHTGGELLMPREMERFLDLLRQRNDIKTVMFSHTRYSELLKLPWLFVLLMLLLTTEWIIRKYNGEI